LTLQRLRFGLSSACEIQARDTHLGLRGVAGRIRTPHDDFEFTSPLVGNHNIYNILSATGVAVALGVPVENIQRGIADLAGVPGRLEQVQNESGISVFVDYAHTPDALDNVLRVLKSLTSGRLITVFGCGGDRDRQKRAMMGAVAGRISDLSVLTSDNPRTESPEAILADIVRGTAEVQPKEYAPDELGNGFSGRGYVMEPDRRKAIGLGLAVAGPGDTVLVAGKGHEPYQILGETTIPFDDKVEVMAALGVLNATANQR
jgi:UDP-N-acetylmuramyl-tripeptide synthetase